MIFASDLDRTLIYSLGAIGVPESTPGLVPAEMIDGRTRSYISERCLEMLQELEGRILFVPVTTRTIAEYKRIGLFQSRLRPDYAVTSNGGNVLVHGAVDFQWRQEILRRVGADSAGADEARRLLRKVLREEWIIDERYCDELFYTYIVQRSLLPKEEIAAMSERLRAQGWKVSVQGRKLYAVPEPVNKRNAALYIKGHFPGRPLIASGDSLLDQCLLESADFAIAPCHGEIFAEQQERPVKLGYPFTGQSGVFAGDEILRYVQQKYDHLTGLEAGIS